MLKCGTLAILLLFCWRGACDESVYINSGSSTFHKHSCPYLDASILSTRNPVMLGHDEAVKQGFRSCEKCFDRKSVQESAKAVQYEDVEDSRKTIENRLAELERNKIEDSEKLQKAKQKLDEAKVSHQQYLAEEKKKEYARQEADAKQNIAEPQVTLAPPRRSVATYRDTSSSRSSTYYGAEGPGSKEWLVKTLADEARVDRETMRDALNAEMESRGLMEYTHGGF